MARIRSSRGQLLALAGAWLCVVGLQGCGGAGDPATTSNSPVAETGAEGGDQRLVSLGGQALEERKDAP